MSEIPRIIQGNPESGYFRLRTTIGVLHGVSLKNWASMDGMNITDMFDVLISMYSEVVKSPDYSPSFFNLSFLSPENTQDAPLEININVLAKNLLEGLVEETVDDISTHIRQAIEYYSEIRSALLAVNKDLHFDRDSHVIGTIDLNLE